MSWITSKIGEYCLVGDGAHAKIPRRESGVMYLTSKNFKPEGLDLSKIDFISEEDFDKHFRRASKAVTKPEPSDVLVSIIGSLGEPYVVRPSDRFGLSSSVAIIRPRQDMLAPEYLYYWMKGGIFQGAVYGTKGGVAQSYLSLEMIRSLPLRFPALSVQRNIVDVLSAYDDLIENNTRRIKSLEKMAKMIYREWFVNFRFPSHEKVEVMESELGLIPDGWHVEPLERHLSVLETGNRPKGGIAGFREGVPSIGAESISGVGRFDYAKTKYVPVEYFEKMNQGVLQDRDVLVYKDGGQPGNFHPHVSLVGEGFPFSKMAINSHVYRLRTTGRITQDYLYYHLSSDESLKWMHLHGTGSAIPGLARKDLLQLPLTMPPKALVQQFDTFAKPLTSLILITAKRTHNLRMTREYLLPKLISGEIKMETLESEAVAQGV